ncbi:MAG: DUF1186 domain-containing protein [Cyanobacteria bacterium J06627_3]
MELTVIMEALKEIRDRKFPREALKQAIAHKDEITPLLLAEFVPVQEKIAEIDANVDYFRHLYALYLLAQFRETKAYPVIIDFISVPDKALMDIMGDLVTEDLGCILASVCGGDLSPIKQLIENPQVNEYVRGAGFKALLTLVVEGEVSRESVLAYFETLWPKLQEAKEEEDDFLSHALLMSILDLYPNESLASVIREAYETDQIDPQWSDIDDLEEIFEIGLEQSIEILASHRYYCFVTDTIASLEWWACFQGNAPKKTRVLPTGLGLSTGFGSPKKDAAKRKKKRQSQKQARKQNRSKKKR